MPDQLVLVDSSVWIRFFRARGAEPASTLLEQLLLEKRVATNWLVRLELLSGAPSEEAYQSLDADLAALHQLPLTDAAFQAASALRWQLHRKGLVTPVVDSLIAACAIYYGCALLHDDQHFRLIARHTPLHILPLRAVKR